MLPKTNHWVPWDFKIQILSNPMESYGFHEILRLNLVKSNGIFWVPWDFKTQILSNPINGIWWVPWGFNYQILSNPKESDGFHEVLPIKSFQIQWNLMGSMRFYLSNLFKSKGIWWVPWDYDNQILSNLIISKILCQWFRRCLLLRGYTREDITRSIMTYRGAY
jgi:hypothetical protein